MVQLKQRKEHDQAMRNHIVASYHNRQQMFEKMKQMQDHMHNALAGQEQLREELARVQQHNQVTQGSTHGGQTSCFMPLLVIAWQDAAEMRLHWAMHAMTCARDCRGRACVGIYICALLVGSVWGAVIWCEGPIMEPSHRIIRVQLTTATFFMMRDV